MRLPEFAAEVIEIRRKYLLWGPATLRARLGREAPEIVWPAASTMSEILKRAGLTVPHKKRRKATPSQSPLSHAAAANQLWSAVFKGWFRCGDGSRCDPLNLSDGGSRFLLACQALAGMDGRQVRGVLEAAFREYCVRSGNASSIARLWAPLSLSAPRRAVRAAYQGGRSPRCPALQRVATLIILFSKLRPPPYYPVVPKRPSSRFALFESSGNLLCFLFTGAKDPLSANF